MCGSRGGGGQGVRTLCLRLCCLQTPGDRFSRVEAHIRLHRCEGFHQFVKVNPSILSRNLPGRVAQSVTCLATDECLTADPGVASSIPARYHTFVEIDHEIISTVILLLPLIYSRRVVVSYKRKYVHKLLVNRLLKPAQEKVWLSELTVPQ